MTGNAFGLKAWTRRGLVLVLTASISALCGCAASRGFDRGALLEEVRLGTPQITEAEVAEVLALRPQLPKPFKVAVYFSPPGSYSLDWVWRGEDKDALLAIKPALQGQGLISDMFVIPEGAVQETTLKAVRVAAARHGADAVLVVSGSEALDRYNNILGVTYLLLLPMAFVPGTELDALFMANAVLWDVRNAYLYISAEAEATAHQTRPTMFIEELQAVNEARRAAMEALAAELARRLTAMEQTAGTH